MHKGRNIMEKEKNTSESKPTLNQYEMKLEARKEAYLAKAKKIQEKADSRMAGVNYISEHLAGTPILVGHHSEKGHRRLLDKMDRDVHKSIQESKKADHYEWKAGTVGTGGISADDPQAIQKLQEQLQEKKEAHELMREANKASRKNDTEKLQDLAKLQREKFPEFFKSYYMIPESGKFAGFPQHYLSLNNASIKRIEGRIQELQIKSEMNEKNEDFPDFSYRVDPDENRVMFEFSGKPRDEIRDALKAEAFKWSPSRDAWVRQITPNALRAGEKAKEELKKLFGYEDPGMKL